MLKNIYTSSIIAAREYVKLFLHISILITSEQLIKIIYHSLEQHGFRCTLSNECHEYLDHVHFNQKKITMTNNDRFSKREPLLFRGWLKQNQNPDQTYPSGISELHGLCNAPS